MLLVLVTTYTRKYRMYARFYMMQWFDVLMLAILLYFTCRRVVFREMKELCLFYIH